MLTLTIAYSGRMPSQGMQEESVTVAAEQRNSQPDDLSLVPAEPKWLYSNRTYWYPQGGVTDYATASMRITVPAEYDVVASGVPASGSPSYLRGRAARERGPRRLHLPCRRSRCGISGS